MYSYMYMCMCVIACKTVRRMCFSGRKGILVGSLEVFTREITLTEFIDGAARLRGGAKAIDVWRMETKLEVLFEEAKDRELRCIAV